MEMTELHNKRIKCNGLNNNNNRISLQLFEPIYHKYEKNGDMSIKRKRARYSRMLICKPSLPGKMELVARCKRAIHLSRRPESPRRRSFLLDSDPHSLQIFDLTWECIPPPLLHQSHSNSSHGRKRANLVT